MWLGAFSSIASDEGYWIVMYGEETLEIEGFPTYPNTVYSLHQGSNLVSYPSPSISLPKISSGGTI